MSPERRIVQTGCSACEKHFGTVEQFKFHLCDDVLTPLLDRLSQTVRESGEGERHEADIHGQECHAGE